ncbi:hypothetical protein C4G84_RS22310 [Vibrio parahaemolyticus O5:K30]|nr:hypothetical protein [Vibrio parahaemolyticus O5:K30]
MKKILIPTILAASFTQAASASQFNEGWEFSLGLGGAYSASEDITIKRDNASDIDLGDVEFENKPFQAPLYYTIRGGKWSLNDGWADSTAFEMELIHHKIYAKGSDLSQGVSKFEVTDGYNLLYVNYAVKKDHWIARAGIGAAIPHPDVIIDGERTHGGYQLAGITGQLSLEREFELNETFALGIESKVTYSYADIDIDGGSVEVPNTAIHLVANLKYRL